MDATQKGRILDYCAEHGSITIREAFEKLYINSPSMGYDVQDITETRINGNGDEVKFKRYFISAPEGSAS